MNGWKWNGIFFAADDNANGGGNSGGEGDNGKTGDDNQDKDKSEKDKEVKKPDFKELLKDPDYQRAFDESIKDRLMRDRETRTEEEREKARKEAGEFKPLYEELKKKHDEELTPKISSYETKLAERDKRLNEIIDGEIKDWDESIKSMDPGPEDVDSRSRWLEKARPAAEKLKSSGIAPDLDHGRKGGGGGTDAAKSYVKGQYEVPESISGKK
jgi:hypothetical protein